MKRIILFFAVCLGLSVSQTTFADNAETARAATKRPVANTVSTTTNSNRSYTSETKRTSNQQNKNTRTATKQNQQRVVSPRTLTLPASVKPRPVTTKQNQTTTNVTKRVSSTGRNTATARTADSRKTTNTKTTQGRSTRSPVYTTNNKKRNARTAELNSEKIESIKSADYSKCKTVYYECMDEFCANKDTNLRRCACSSRIHEFDGIKKQLSDAEDKMLDFNQRLLTVSLDKEDAAAVNVATEGELAFDTKDKSESEKLLQKITKTLNSSGDSKINNNLSAISLSLDMDTAWDSIDSLSGIATTSKSGLDLYNAARPVCIEMAKEVCSDDELSIAQDGYKLTIQQDCNTVAKSYDTQYNKAMEKIHESGALLDISRLTVHQQRNSDDILTCKKKILNQLSDVSVCGENLYKCLDMTGQYIDPSTGKAFLSEDLSNLSNLLLEPTGDEKWSKIAQNESFVKFLDSKKEFLKPAIEQCRDISDTVWKEFLDDALSQIKLAQKAKIEEIRQGCTTLVAECKTDALTDLAEFDSRALSIFSVAADKTANEMCSNIESSCIALMGDDTANIWGGGMTGISTNITYNTIIDTCSQVGRDCIIQKCNGVSGNFALCTNITSDNRMAILNRDACWQDVLDCVNGADNLKNMTNLPIIANRDAYYSSTYSVSNIPTLCNGPLTNTDLTACLIAEQIWGNCEHEPGINLPILTYDINSDDFISSNKILMPNSGSTLLSWLATNTNTNNNIASCSAYGCPVNYQMNNETNTCELLTENGTTQSQTINVASNLTNICGDDNTPAVRDTFRNCCASGYKNNGICVPNDGDVALRLVDGTCSAINGYYCPNYSSANPRILSYYCITSGNSSAPITVDNNTYTCDGRWVIIDQYGNYFDIEGTTTPSVKMYYNPDTNDTSNKCEYTYTTSGWTWSGTNCNAVSDVVPTNNEFTIEYQ